MQFLTKENIHSVLLDPTIIHTRKEYQSYFSLPNEILQLESKLVGMSVFGSDSEKNIYKPFSNLFHSSFHFPFMIFV